MAAQIDANQCPTVKQLRAHFAALEKSRENQLVNSNNSKSNNRGLSTCAKRKTLSPSDVEKRPVRTISPYRNPFVKKVKSLRLIRADSLIRDAISFIVQQGTTLGFLEPDELLRFPNTRGNHPQQLRKKTFFTRLLKRENTLNDWTASEISAAVTELKLLNFSQLLTLLQLANASGRTNRSMNPNDCCNREHAGFKERLQALVYEGIIFKAISIRRCSLLENQSEFNLMSRPRSSSSAAVLTAALPAESDGTAVVLHDDNNRSFYNASDREKQQVGREMLLSLGITRRLLDRGDNLNASSHCDLRAHINQYGLWWRIFIPRLTPDQKCIGGVSKVLMIVEDPHPSRNNRLTKRMASDNSQTRPDSTYNTETNKNYLIRARCALKPATKGHHPDASWRGNGDGISEIKNRGAWKRGISQMETLSSCSATRNGIEAYMHYPSLKICFVRPQGVPLFAYAADTDVNKFEGGGISSQVLNLDVLRFDPDATNFDLPSNASLLSACIFELRDKLRAMGEQQKNEKNIKYKTAAEEEEYNEEGYNEDESQNLNSNMSAELTTASSNCNENRQCNSSPEFSLRSGKLDG